MKMKGMKDKNVIYSYAEIPVLECITARQQWSPEFKIIIRQEGWEHSRRKKPHTEKFKIFYIPSEDSLTESNIISYKRKNIL